MTDHVPQQSPSERNRKRRTSLPHSSITGQMLRHMAGDSGNSYRIASPSLASDDVALHGRFNNYRCHSGLWVHATDTQEAHDLSTEIQVEPSLSVAVVLEGCVDLDLGGQASRLGDEGGVCGQLWMLTRPTRLIRKSRKGTRVRKVIITLPPSWVGPAAADHASADPVSRFLATHQAMFFWSPSKRVLALTEQILNPPEEPDLLRRMAVESRAIEIVTAALSHLEEFPPSRHATTAPTAPTVRVLTSGQAIRNHIQAHLDGDLNLNRMAKELGMSVESMQRAFKAAYDTTVADFIRECRLHRAREALDRDGISVSQAAYLAGYSHPANFSTAFKKLFGLTPSQAKG